MLDFKRKIDLAQYMIEKAESDIDTSNILLSIKKYEASINRSYYAVFSCMRAVLALDVVEFKKHSGIISYFSREYLKTNIFDKKYAKTVRDAFMYRNKSDYEYFYIAFKSDAEEQYNNAKEFLEVIKSYVEKRIKEIEVQEDDL